MRSLATELRAGGAGALALAFALGAVHALTPGHGKSALVAYFLGGDGSFATGLRVALSASLLHVVSGFLAFLALSFVVGQSVSLSGRGSPWFMILGYGLIVLAGLIMLWQSFLPNHEHHHDTGTITLGIGLLPCPLTISVLGFTWIQGTPAMVLLVLVTLTLGIATTIGMVAVAAIWSRRLAGAAIATHVHGLEQWARVLQGSAGAAIVVIGIYTLIKALA